MPKTRQTIGPYRLSTGGAVLIHLHGASIERLEPSEESPNLPVVFPGLIDMHVHLREPGAEHKEDMATGSRAALIGGVTTLGDMPNNRPFCDTFAQWRDKQERARAKAANDIFFHMGATEHNYDEIARAHETGLVKATKIYMGESTDSHGLDRDSLKRHFRQARELGYVLMLHAEDDAVIARNRELFEPKVGHHHQIRSAEAEINAVKEALELAAQFGNKTHICHLSTRESFELAAEAKRQGLPVSIEVTPHHLLLDYSYTQGDNGSFYQVNPPLRSAEDAAFLRTKLQSSHNSWNQIDTIGTDHAPHLIKEKQKPYPHSPSGLPSIEFLLPLMVQLQQEGYMDIKRLQDLLSANAARIFSLQDRGQIAPGQKADLVAWDPIEARAITDNMVQSRCAWSPYSGQKLSGWPTEVFFNGQRLERPT